jgi:hypothetical protein
MLKFTYGEVGICLEHLPQSVEQLVARRAILAVRTQARLLVEPCSASFLLAANLDQLSILKTLVQADATGAIALSMADANHVEVSVTGVWMAADAETVEGVFVLSLSPTVEELLVNLWRRSQLNVSLV